MERVYVLCMECGQLGRVYRSAPDAEPSQVAHIIPAQAPDDPGGVVWHRGNYIVFREDDLWEMAEGVEGTKRVLKRYFPAPIVDQMDRVEDLVDEAKYYVMEEEKKY